jgi:hypothetical protein
MPKAPYRWTLDEFVLRTELADDSLREVVVEGSVDRSFIEDTLDRYLVENVVVYDGDYFDVTAQAVESAGFASGVKGALLTLALALAGSAVYAANGAIVIIIVDRDYDGLPERDFGGIALVTDYYSMENYTIARRSMDRFVRQVLVRERRPRGRGGEARRERHACTGSELIERVLPAAAAMAGVRLLLKSLDPPVRVIESWTDYFQVKSDGHFESRTAEVVAATLQRARSKIDDVEERFKEALAVAETAPRTYVRGRDFVRLLHKLLKSAWGRRNSSVNFAVVDEPTVTTWVLAAAHPADLDDEPLFTTLRQNLQAA